MCLLTLWSCSSDTLETSLPIGDPQFTDIENSENLTEVLNYKENLYRYPKLLSESLNGLSFIKNKWESTNLLCFENEDFFYLKNVNKNRFIAISSKVSDLGTKDFYFYDINKLGNIINRQVIFNASLNLDNRYNFILRDSLIYYFLDKTDKQVYVYSLNNLTHKPTNEHKLNWDNIENWRMHSIYKSPSNKYSIEFTDVSLILRNFETKKIDTLINQSYEGSWSFGLGEWNSSSTKFYFDNSGAIACIWELDIVNCTIDKIVSEHWASSPVVMSDSLENEVLYCEKNCIKKTKLE